MAAEKNERSPQFVSVYQTDRKLVCNPTGDHVRLPITGLRCRFRERVGTRAHTPQTAHVVRIVLEVQMLEVVATSRHIIGVHHAGNQARGGIHVDRAVTLKPHHRTQQVQCLTVERVACQPRIAQVLHLTPNPVPADRQRHTHNRFDSSKDNVKMPEIWDSHDPPEPYTLLLSRDYRRRT